jgi:adenylate cyclase
MNLYRRFTSRDNAQAREFFRKATVLVPEFAKAQASLAATHRQDWILAWSDNLQESKRLAYQEAEKAVALARKERAPKPSLAYALVELGWWHVYSGEPQGLQNAEAMAAEAVDHSPNFADAYALKAHALIYQGQPEPALAETQKAVDHDPQPFFYDYHRGHAYYVWGFQTSAEPQRTERFKEAEKHLKNALAKSPNFRPARSYLVAALSELKQQDEAVDQMIEVRKRGGRPDYLRDPKELQKFVDRTLPYKDKKITARLIQLWQTAEKQAAEKEAKKRS